MHVQDQITISSVVFLDPLTNPVRGFNQQTQNRFSRHQQKRRWFPTAFKLDAKTSICNLGNNASTNGAAAFADGEAQLFFHGDWRDQLNIKRDVVARHHHFSAFWQGPITITQRGKPRLILMSVEEYNRLRGKLVKQTDEENQA
jgi:hypothetical protein